MTEQKLKILIVEDYLPILQGFVKILGGDYLVLQATTCKDAEKVLKKNPDVQLVAMDGILEYDGKKNSTIELIKKIRKEYPAIKIIAMSLNEDTRKAQVESGCQHVIKNDDKTQAIGIIRTILPPDKK